MSRSNRIEAMVLVKFIQTFLKHLKAVSIVKIVGLAIIVNVGKTTTEILTLKGAIAVLASEIAELQGYIAEANVK